MTKTLENIRFISSVGDGKTTACLMSARALLDGRPFGDAHPSATLRTVGIKINDGPWWKNDKERTRVLMPLALDERLCAEKCHATAKTEKKRAKLCAHWALSWAAPFALDQAAVALKVKFPEHAKALRKHAATLRRKPTRKNALAANKVANAAYYAANAAAYAAANATAANATAAADAANAAYAAAVYAAYAAANAADAAKYAAAAADAAAYAAANAAKREIRDSLIGLFDRMLDVCES